MTRTLNGSDGSSYSVLVDVYEVSASASHTLDATTSIKASYPLQSTSIIVKDETNIEAIGYVELSNVTTTGADLKGYLYFIEELAGATYDRWFPLDPGLYDVPMEYALIVKDANFSTAVEEVRGDVYKIYPNPTSSAFTMELGENCHEVQILDQLGRSKVAFSTCSNIEVIDTKDWSQGIYYVVIFDGIQKQKTFSIAVH